MKIMKISCLVACLFVVGSLGEAKAGELPKRFLSAYQPIAERGAQAYSHFVMRGDLVKQSPDKDQAPWRYNIVYRRSGDRLRLDEQTIGGAKDKQLSCDIAFPLESFSASRKSAGDPFTLHYHSVSHYDDFRDYIWIKLTFFSPYSPDLTGTLIDYLRRPEIKIVSYEEYERDGQPFVKISAQVITDGRTPAIQVTHDITLVLSPHEGWALREFVNSDLAWAKRWHEEKHEDCGGAAFHWTFAYDGARDGVPLLKKMDHWQDNSDSAGGTVDDCHQTLTVTNIDFTAPPVAEFTPASLDLEIEPGSPDTTPISRD